MGYELFRERDALCKELSESIHEMRRYGRQYAEAEANYNVQLAKTALRMKDEGTPVTLINMVIRGTGEVPNLRMKRDIAESLYKASTEHIQSIKLQLRLIEAQIEREWSQRKREM